MSKTFQNNVVFNSDSVADTNTADSTIFLSSSPDSISGITDSVGYQELGIQDTLQFTEEVKPAEVHLPVAVRNNVNSDWLTIFFLAAFVLLVTVRVGFHKYISSLFQSVINYPTAFRLFREKNYSFLHGAFRLEVMFYIIFSVFIYQVIIIQNYVKTPPGFIFFAKTAGLIVAYYIIKKFLYWLAGAIFKTTSETAEFLFNLDNSNRIVGIILFPVVTLIAYSPFGNPMIIMYVGAFVTAILYLMLLQRGALILLKKQFSIFYLFLYLCTLEFLPLLLIFKIVVD